MTPIQTCIPEALQRFGGGWGEGGEGGGLAAGSCIGFFLQYRIGPQAMLMAFLQHL